MIYVFLADGFEEIEALTPVDILRRAELEVRTVGVSSKTVRGAHGIPVVCDLMDTQVSPEEMEMLVLPGGMPGTLNLEKSDVVQAMIRYAAQQGRYIGAICAAPSILGHMGLLDGLEYTCFPSFETQIPKGKYTAGACETAGKIITAAGAGVALEFSLRLVSVLLGQERADAIKAAVQCR